MDLDPVDLDQYGTRLQRKELRSSGSSFELNRRA